MRITDFYCPHCNKYKKRFQVKTRAGTEGFYCKRCGCKLIETEKFLNTLIMGYKGYVGSIELSKGDSLFCGKVLGIPALISYEGKTVAALVEDFHNAVDDYLAWEMDEKEKTDEKT
jgi:hypothetical protein